MKCKLVKPTKKYEKEWNDYVVEYISDNDKLLPLEYKLNTDYNEWLKYLNNESKGINLLPGRVPSTKYFLVDEYDKIVGGISIRHSINTEYLKKYGGHIGYGIRPSERKKGYGNIILSLGLKEIRKMKIKKVLVTVLDSNICSKKIIEKNGGVLENKINFDNDLMCRYWIDL